MRRQRPDRRVARTQRALREALRDLMRERGFEALTVQEIADRADVGRSTFYAHYDGKDDLLLSSLGELEAALEEARLRGDAGSGGEGAFAFARYLFAHAAEHRDLFRNLVGEQGGAVVMRYFRRMLVDLVRADVQGSRPAVPRRHLEPLVQYLGGGLFGLLTWWLEAAEGRPSVDEVSAVFRSLALAARTGGAAPSR